MDVRSASSFRVYQQLMRNTTPGNSGASVIPKKKRTVNKVGAFVVNAVAMETPDQIKVVHGRYTPGLTRVRSIFEGSWAIM